MSDVARAPAVLARFPVISQALLAGASAQLRNMASMGGNLCQRVRCGYFRDVASPCNKRDPGSVCGAMDGMNRGHAILGGSGTCIATHPSDVAVALTAVGAVVHTRGLGGERAPEDWITSASLSFAGAAIILHVGVGLRWPFAGLRRDAMVQGHPDDLHPALRAELAEDAGDIGLDRTS
jgi:hypothetical protein